VHDSHDTGLNINPPPKIFPRAKRLLSPTLKRQKKLDDDRKDDDRKDDDRKDDRDDEWH
jgi:hypothetical protein